MFLAYWTRFSCLRTRALSSPACFFSSSPNVLPGMVGYDMIAWRYEKITASIQVGSLVDASSRWVVFLCYTHVLSFSGDLRWSKKVLVITKLCWKGFQGLSCVMIDLTKTLIRSLFTHTKTLQTSSRTRISRSVNNVWVTWFCFW